MSTATAATPGKLYDRSFVMAFLCNLLFVPANTLLVHYAQWIEYLHHGDQQKALVDLGYITSSGVIISFIARPWLGQLVNRWGSKNTWFFGYLLLILGDCYQHSSLYIHQ